eukprot:11448465-Karenia_brevis.AAC.1
MLVEGAGAQHVFAEDAHGEDEKSCLSYWVFCHNLQHLAGATHPGALVQQVYLVPLLHTTTVQYNDQW